VRERKRERDQRWERDGINNWSSIFLPYSLRIIDELVNKYRSEDWRKWNGMSGIDIYYNKKD